MELSKEKRRHFLEPLILSEGNLFNICVLSQCIVNWIHFQNIYTFTYQKKFLLTLLLLVFKIVQYLQSILKQGNLEISAFKANHNYCRISPRYFEHKIKLSCHSKDVLEWKLSQIVFKEYLPENGDANDRSVCFQIIQSNSKIFCLETGTLQSSYLGNSRKF